MLIMNVALRLCRGRITTLLLGVLAVLWLFATEKTCLAEDNGRASQQSTAFVRPTGVELPCDRFNLDQ